MKYMAFVGVLSLTALVWSTVFGVLSVHPPMDLLVARFMTVMLSTAIAWRLLSGGWEP